MSELSMYSGATGMENEQTNLDIIANDLANMNSTGYKKVKGAFADLMYQQLRSVGADAGAGDSVATGVEVGNGSQLVSTNRVFTQGKIQHTGQSTDLAINGDGFLEVLRPDGSLAYTRAGDLRVNSQGQVVTSTGYAVQSGFQSIPTGGEISISSNGQVTVQTPSGDTTFALQLSRFPNPGGLRGLGNNLFMATDSSGSVEAGTPGSNGFGEVMQGSLEKSNVNAVQSMVDMIIAQRSYEMNSKSIQTSDSMLDAANHLKR